MTRKFCVVTGTRAEYGLLRPLMRLIQAQPGSVLQLVVTGTHLIDRFGRTKDEIEADGFPIDVEVDLRLDGDSPLAVARSLGMGTIGIADALARLAPHMVIILGDRYEMLAVAQAALILGIPIAHISGGDLTEGAVDDSIRHAITKMSHLHFVYTEEYARRVIQLGEAPERVFNVGALGADVILGFTPIPRISLESDLGLALDPAPFLLTYHPETVSEQDQAVALEEILAALDCFSGHPVVVTGVNADPGHGVIAQALAEYAARNQGRVVLIQSLGQLRYLSVMALAAAVVGNSSSGIIEAPIMRIPTINIGDRQKGRQRSPSIIDTLPRCQDIVSALAKALSPEFRITIADMPCPYGDGAAARRILDVLIHTDPERLRFKSFHDLP